MAKSLAPLLAALSSRHENLNDGVGIPELIPVQVEKSSARFTGSRLNIVIPGIFERLSYGGIVTALRLFQRLAADFPYARIVLLNQTEAEFDFESWPDWSVDRGEATPRAIAFLGDETTPLSVSLQDYFLATAWTTAVFVREVVARQAQLFGGKSRRFAYFIQDYEPAFYSWSSRYACAHSTYQHGEGTIAVYNSRLLADYFRRRELGFSEWHVYEPVLHPTLKKAKERRSAFIKERLILVYGRPSTPRNAFELLTAGLRIWAATFPSAHEWRLISAGEPHENVPLSGSVSLESRGKLTMEEYADHLSRCWVGLSFMISPHPSYPPLEMAEFGGWVITNRFENKNLVEWSPNLVSADLTPEAIAARLAWCCERYESGRTAVLDGLGPVFRGVEEEFPFAGALVKSWRSEGVE